MITEVKKDLAKMKKDRPGERFADQHRRAKKEGLATGWGRAVCLGLSVVSMVIGIVLVFIPGPAFVFFLLSAVLLASQWRAMAEWMDRAEVKGRKLWKGCRGRWRRFRGKSAR